MMVSAAQSSLWHENRGQRGQQERKEDGPVALGEAAGGGRPSLVDRTKLWQPQSVGKTPLQLSHRLRNHAARCCCRL